MRLRWFFLGFILAAFPARGLFAQIVVPVEKSELQVGHFGLPVDLHSPTSQTVLGLHGNSKSPSGAALMLSPALPPTGWDLQGVFRNNRVQLSWRTPAPYAKGHVLLESSSDGKQFEILDRVYVRPGQGSHYECTQAKGSTRFYRLRFPSDTGPPTFSPTIRLLATPIASTERLQVAAEPSLSIFHLVRGDGIRVVETLAGLETRSSKLADLERRQGVVSENGD